LKQIQRKSNGELWEMVTADDLAFLHTYALLTLATREEDVSKELPRIINMLESDEVLTRVYGSDALRFVFTDEHKVISDYEPRNSVDKCRAKVALLRASLRGSSN
jgi:hypothetical protein